MRWEMRLHPRPFEQVAVGNKVIEMRLNDEKRQQLRVGDQIEFTSRADEVQKVLVEITALPTFATFKELGESFPPAEYGSESRAEYEEMYQYYSPEDEAKYGVVAIKFKVLNN